MHNNQIGCLARRVYIYLQAPCFRGVSEGHPCIEGSEWGVGPPLPRGLTEVTQNGQVQRVSSGAVGFGFAVIHPIADGVPRYAEKLCEILHLHAESFVFRHDVSPCNGYVAFFSLYIKEIKLSFL